MGTTVCAQARKGAGETPNTDGTPSRILFVNWPTDQQADHHCDLLAGHDFSDYGIVFLDPLEFAVAHGLRSNCERLSESEYISYDEREFSRFLTGIKRASESLRELLHKGGLLVIRSQIPNSHIKVRKRSSAGSGSYTESVLSAFFWLEDILGKYTFNSCRVKAIRFVAPGDPLGKPFARAGVDCVQTQDFIEKGQREVVAAGGPYFKDPVVSRIVCDDWRGLVYVIPKFRVLHEERMLVEAFQQVVGRHKRQSSRPTWITRYLTELDELSPYQSGIDLAKAQLEAIHVQLTKLQRKQDDLRRVTSILYQHREELTSAVSTALALLEYDVRVHDACENGVVLEAVEKGIKGARLIFMAAACDEGPLPSSNLVQLTDIVDKQQSNVRVKGVLIGNADRNKPPELRTTWFDQECLELARQSDLCLLPTVELYTIIGHLLRRSDSSKLESIKTSIRRDIIACDSHFKLNRKKYGL
jgi:hypothetical protein